MKHENDRLSSGQQLAVFRLAALAVTVGILPRIAARQAGRAAWLAPVLAAPALWALGRVFGRLTDRGRRSYAAVCRERVGQRTSAALYIIYILWGLVLAGAVLRLSVQRLYWAGGWEAEHWLLPVLAAAAVWLVWGGLATFGRTAVLLCRGVEVCLALVLVLTVWQVRRTNLLPVWAGDALPAARSGVTALGLMCCGFYAAFLPGTEGTKKGEGHGWTLRCGWLCLLLTGTLAAVIGAQGAELTGQLADPFLALSRHAGLEGAFQRIESLVCAAWLPADLVLMGLVIGACRELAVCLRPRLSRRAAIFLPVAAVLIVAAGWFRDASAARVFCQRWLPLGGLVLFGLVPAFLLLVEGAAYLVGKRGKNK